MNRKVQVVQLKSEEWLICTFLIISFLILLLNKAKTI